MTLASRDRLLRLLRGRGMTTPAAILVDAHRPLAPLLADLSAAYGPLAGIMGGRPVTDVRAVLEDAHGLDRLADELIDPPTRGPHAGAG